MEDELNNMILLKDCSSDYNKEYVLEYIEGRIYRYYYRNCGRINLLEIQGVSMQSLVQKRIELEKELKQKEMEVTEIRKQIDAITPALKSWFANEGLKSVRGEGGTVKVSRQFWVSVPPANRQHVASYLRGSNAVYKESPLKNIITVNAIDTRSLSAHCRSFSGKPQTVEEFINALPDELRGHVVVRMDEKIAVTK